MGVSSTEAGDRGAAGRGGVWTRRASKGVQYQRQEGIQIRRCQDAET